MNPYEAFPRILARPGEPSAAGTLEVWPGVLLYRLIVGFERMALSLRARRWSGGAS